MNGGYATSKYLFMNRFLTCFLERKGKSVGFSFYPVSGEMKEGNLKALCANMCNSGIALHLLMLSTSKKVSLFITPIENRSCFILHNYKFLFRMILIFDSRIHFITFQISLSSFSDKRVFWNVTLSNCIM